MTTDDKYYTAKVRFNHLKVEEFIDYASNIAPIWVGKVLHGIWINCLFEFQGLRDIFRDSNTKANVQSTIWPPGRNSQVPVSFLMLNQSSGLMDFTN